MHPVKQMQCDESDDEAMVIKEVAVVKVVKVVGSVEAVEVVGSVEAVKVVGAVEVVGATKAIGEVKAIGTVEVIIVVKAVGAVEVVRVVKAVGAVEAIEVVKVSRWLRLRGCQEESSQETQQTNPLPKDAVSISVKDSYDMPSHLQHCPELQHDLYVVFPWLVFQHPEVLEISLGSNKSCQCILRIPENEMVQDL